MERKLIFLDIDGTLTPPGTSIPPESALAAIRQARERGHKVFLCSGRNLGMQEGVLSYGFDGTVASAGGYVVCGGKVLYARPIAEEQLRWTLALLDGAEAYYLLETRDAAYGSEAAVELMASSKGGGSEAERWKRALRENLRIHPLRERGEEPVYKVFFITQHTQRLPMEELSKVFFVCDQNVFAHDGVFRGELIHRDFDKGTGMACICEHLGATLADTVAFGDSMNDLAMLQAAGVGVCMENGDPALKEFSDLICPRVDDDGLAKAFCQLGLI